MQDLFCTQTHSMTLKRLYYYVKSFYMSHGNDPKQKKEKILPAEGSEIPRSKKSISTKKSSTMFKEIHQHKILAQAIPQMFNLVAKLRSAGSSPSCIQVHRQREEDHVKTSNMTRGLAMDCKL